LINLALQKDYFIKRLDDETSDEEVNENEEMERAHLRQILSMDSTP